jgi:hypothetical protein
MDGARVAYRMAIPAFLARASKEVMAGTMIPVHFGCDGQMGSTMSSTSTALVAGLRVTCVGSGSAGICSVSMGLAAPLVALGVPVCAMAAPPQAESKKPLVKKTVRKSFIVEPPW